MKGSPNGQNFQKPNLVSFDKNGGNRAHVDQNDPTFGISAFQTKPGNNRTTNNDANNENRQN